MILFSGIEVLEGKFLYGQWLLVVFLFFGKHLFDDRQVLRVGVVDACTIAGAFIVSLLVEACGVDGFEEHLQQELQAYDIRVVFHMYGLGISRSVGIYFLVGGILLKITGSVLLIIFLR